MGLWFEGIPSIMAESVRAGCSVEGVAYSSCCSTAPKQEAESLDKMRPSVLAP